MRLTQSYPPWPIYKLALSSHCHHHHFLLRRTVELEAMWLRHDTPRLQLLKPSLHLEKTLPVLAHQAFDLEPVNILVTQTSQLPSQFRFHRDIINPTTH